MNILSNLEQMSEVTRELSHQAMLGSRQEAFFAMSRSLMASSRQRDAPLVPFSNAFWVETEALSSRKS